MAASKVGMANAALIEIGVATISSLDDDVEAARLVKERFDDLLEEMLMETEWTFATHRVQISALKATPPFGWTYYYQLPSDCLHPIEEYEGNDYIVEGRKILCDASPIKLIYLRNVTDVNELSSLFRKAFSLAMAAYLALPLQGSAQLKDRMDGKAELALAKAMSRDSQIGTPKDQADGSWLDART